LTQAPLTQMDRIGDGSVQGGNKKIGPGRIRSDHGLQPRRNDAALDLDDPEHQIAMNGRGDKVLE